VATRSRTAMDKGFKIQLEKFLRHFAKDGE
jgi:hypothetical protein